MPADTVRLAEEAEAETHRLHEASLDPRSVRVPRATGFACAGPRAPRHGVSPAPGDRGLGPFAGVGLGSGGSRAPARGEVRRSPRSRAHRIHVAMVPPPRATEVVEPAAPIGAGACGVSRLRSAFAKTMKARRSHPGRAGTLSTKPDEPALEGGARPQAT